eukprot:6204034-Pleurochrysis_carterae.AAC.3
MQSQSVRAVTRRTLQSTTTIINICSSSRFQSPSLALSVHRGRQGACLGHHGACLLGPRRLRSACRAGTAPQGRLVVSIYAAISLRGNLTGMDVRSNFQAIWSHVMPNL